MCFAAYMELREYYHLFMTLPQMDFIDFINPENTVGRLLQAHFVALQLVVSRPYQITSPSSFTDSRQ